AVVHPAGDPGRTPTARPFGAPSGCPSGAVCFYRSGDGGDLCGIWYGDAPDLAGCATNAMSVLNNGDPCGGCEDIALYWGGPAKGTSPYYGAWNCLPRGHYLLYMDKNRFDDDHNKGLSGYNERLGNNVASAKWTRC